MEPTHSYNMLFEIIQKEGCSLTMRTIIRVGRKMWVCANSLKDKTRRTNIGFSKAKVNPKIYQRHDEKGESFPPDEKLVRR